jgi:hypothetical protein
LGTRTFLNLYEQGTDPVAPNYMLVDEPDSTSTSNATRRLGRVKYVQSLSDFVQQYVENFADRDRLPPSATNIPDWMRTVKNYSFRPESLDFMKHHRDIPSTLLFFGLELEVSSAIQCIELQHIVTEVEPKQNPFFYFKSDSSISGRHTYLYEIVTQPMTPKLHKTEWTTLFKKIEKLAEAKGKTLDDVFDQSMQLTNGIHIHVSADAFIQNSYTDQKHRNRFVTALNQWEPGFQTFLQKVTRRPYKIQDNSYCKVHPGMDGMMLSRRISRGPTVEYRHAACHISGPTVEVRVFYGLPDLQHILSCVEFTEAMFDYTTRIPNSSFGSRFVASFTEWVFKQDGYRRIKETIKTCV